MKKILVIIILILPIYPCSEPVFSNDNKSWIFQGEYQGAFDIFDNECAPRANKSGAMLDIVDVCSLLYRLEMEG